MDCTDGRNLDQDLVQNVMAEAHEVCDGGGT